MLRYMFMLPDGWAERMWVIIDIVSPDAPDDSYCQCARPMT